MAKPLTQEQFKALRVKGLSVDQIVKFERGERPQGQETSQIEDQNAIGATFNVPGATSRAAIRSNPALGLAGPLAGLLGLAGAGGQQAQQAAGQGALNPSSQQTFQDQAIQAGQNAFGGPSTSVATNFMKGLIPSAVGFGADFVTDPTQVLLAMVGIKGGKSKIANTPVNKIIKYDNDLKLAEQAKTSIENVKGFLGKAKGIAISEAADIKTNAEFEKLYRLKKVLHAIRDPIYEIEMDVDGGIKQTVGNLDKVKTAIGELISKKDWVDGASRTEQRLTKNLYRNLRDEMINSAAKEGKDLKAPLEAYSNFMDNYHQIEPRLTDQWGQAQANKLKSMFKFFGSLLLKRPGKMSLK